ncbi:hypothetical protein N7540_000109 [Penicillium herquei]|nr:hypothetical protein N7540_000109 [Penicillium herquei]
MGNSYENSVYSCWLELIFQRLSSNSNTWMSSSKRKISDPFLERLRTPSENSIGNKESYLFWLDVLCIPAKAKGQKHLRRQAIERIPAVFSGAKKVLIFDSEMIKSRLGGSKPVEILGRFLGCNWPTRGWTYQEGAHSLEAMIQLSDCSISTRYLNRLDWDWRDFMCPTPESFPFSDEPLHIRKPYRLAYITLQALMERSISISFWLEVAKWFPMGSVFQTPFKGWPSGIFAAWISIGNTRELAFVDCWNMLLSRSCTDENDKLIILTMAMNLSMHQVMRIPCHERLTSMLWSLQAIPLDILMAPPAEPIEAPESPTPRSMRNLWVPEYFNAPSFNTAPTILPGEGKRLFGHFSTDKTKLFLTPSKVFGWKLMAITIPEPIGRLSWLRLQYFDQKYVVQFHRAADNNLDFSQYSGVVFVVDLRLSKTKRGTHGETWISGCCLLVKDQKRMEVIYDSAISILQVRDFQEPHSFHVRNPRGSWSSVASLTVNSAIERSSLLTFIKSQYHTTSLTTILADALQIYWTLEVKKDDFVLALLCVMLTFQKFEPLMNILNSDSTTSAYCI